MPNNPLHWIDDELNTLETLGLRRTLRSREGAQGAQVVIDGRTFVNFGSNDYLDLANDPRLADAVAESLTQEGWGAGASPLILGRGAAHVELERRIAEFEGVEAALVFPSGFAANAGTIPALATRGDIVFSDSNNHASIIDGCRLSGARVQTYPHSDVEYLSQMMQQSTQFRRRLIVTDTLFSMDGDFARLEELADLAEQFDAMLLVDEAHATGVFGERGRGLCERFGVEDLVHIRIGTLSKALGCAGGFVAGPKSLIDFLSNRARSYVFSTAPPAAWCAAAACAIGIVRDEPQRRADLLHQATQVRSKLAAQGWQIGDGASQIIPIYVGEPEPTMNLAASLLDRGLFVPGIRPPSVPPGQSLLRISLTAGHSAAMLDRLAAEFASLRGRQRSNSN